MIPEKTIEELITRHSSLEKDLASGKVDKKLFAEKSKEYSDLNEIIGIAKKSQAVMASFCFIVRFSLKLLNILISYIKKEGHLGLPRKELVSKEIIK